MDWVPAMENLMAGKHYSNEVILKLLREIELHLASGRPVSWFAAAKFLLASARRSRLPGKGATAVCWGAFSWGGDDQGLGEHKNCKLRP
jgi:hypothetical protein